MSVNMPTRIELVVTPWSGELVGEPGPQTWPSEPKVPVAWVAAVDPDDDGEFGVVPARLQPTASAATAASTAMVLCGFTVILLDADPCGGYHSEYDALIE
jgi:hypothetical protein